MSIADLRGDPRATQRWEALRVFKLARFSKRDVSYDLGCGHGLVCIWAAGRCKLAKGIESHRSLVRTARNNVQKRGLDNVEIIWGDFTQHRFPDANILYCIVRLHLDNFQRWNRRVRKKDLRIVTLGPPPIPIKPVATTGNFCLTRFPFELAKTKDEWHCAVVGKRNAT